MYKIIYKNSITRRQFINDNSDKQIIENIKCTICYNDINQIKLGKKKQFIITKCNHYFCLNCFIKNYVYNKTCPICRYHCNINDIIIFNSTIDIINIIKLFCNNIKNIILIISPYIYLIKLIKLELNTYKNVFFTSDNFLNYLNKKINNIIFIDFIDNKNFYSKYQHIINIFKTINNKNKFIKINI